MAHKQKHSANLLANEKVPKPISRKRPPKEKGVSGRPKGSYKFTPGEVIAAVNGSGGLYTGIAANLEESTGRKCSWDTVSNYVKNNPDIQAAVEIEREATLDMAEGNLLNLVSVGDLPAIMYFLNCKGRHRGYSYKSGHSESGGPINVTVALPAAGPEAGK